VNDSLFSIATIDDENADNDTSIKAVVETNTLGSSSHCVSIQFLLKTRVSTFDQGQEEDGDVGLSLQDEDENEFLTRRYPIHAFPPLQIPPWLSHDNRTGLIFESSPQHFDRHNRYHKERPIRVDSTRDYLLQSVHNFAQRCVHLTLRNAASDSNAWKQEIPHDESTFSKFCLEEEDYVRVHLLPYIQRFKILCDKESSLDARLDNEQSQYPSIYLTPHSYASAQAASSSLCYLVSQVLDSKLDNGFAIIRPPGHHTEPCFTGGYCILNNVAIAAKYAIQKFNVGKILIVDWDVHHGNGTQRIFLEESNVLYFSVHRYHGGNFFPFMIKNSNAGDSTKPNLSSGSPHVVGVGKGEGYNVNVGWNKKGFGDTEYLSVWSNILMPIAYEYEPDLVLISAGFDAAQGKSQL